MMDYFWEEFILDFFFTMIFLDRFYHQKMFYFFIYPILGGPFRFSILGVISEGPHLKWVTRGLSCFMLEKSAM